MDLIDTLSIHRYHSQCVHLHGAGTVGSLGWKNQEGQQARFKVLSEIGDLSHSSVLDAGCGYGDLRGYLGENYPGLRYLGVDLGASFLDRAIHTYSHLPDTSFFQGDFSAAELPVTDYILASGALNYRNSDPDFILRTIAKLFNSCRIGFGFNLLKQVSPNEKFLVAYAPEMIVEHCRTLTSTVVLKENYYEQDYTVMMYGTEKGS